eukprot:scaffold2146_cov425-Prasinococcus_capsulatus_cf.AAC.3
MAAPTQAGQEGAHRRRRTARGSAPRRGCAARRTAFAPHTTTSAARPPRAAPRWCAGASRAPAPARGRAARPEEPSSKLRTPPGREGARGAAQGCAPHKETGLARRSCVARAQSAQPA